MKVVEMRLTEQVAMERKENWHLHQQVEEIGKPRTERPEQSNETKFQVVRAANLAEDSLDQAERREGIRLQIVPGLNQSIDRCRLRIRHRRKVNLEAVIEGGREQIHRHRPEAEKAATHLLMEGPFGAQHLPIATESVSQHVEATRTNWGSR